MNMKRFAACLLAALMVVAMAACGGNNNQQSSTPGGNAGNSTSAGNDAPAGTVTIKVGGIGPLTGDLAQYGTATEWGAQVAVDEINALNGPIRLEYDFQDDTGVAETGVAAYNSLKDWDVDVIYGTTTTAPCVAVASETFADRYFQLTPSASSPDVTAGKDNAFQMCFTDPGQGVAAAEYLQNAGLGTKIGVIYNNGDAYSTGIADAFIAKAKEVGLEVVTTQTFPDDKTTDYTVQLNACKNDGADLIFLPIYYTPASLVLAQAKQMGYTPTFFGADGMDGMLDIEGFDKSLAEGLLLMTPFNAAGTDERTKSFVEKYQAAHNILPNQFAADGYDCMYAIYEACCEIDGIANMNSSELCDALIAKFTGGSFSVDGLTGTSMKWLESGEVSKAPVVVKVESGVYVTQ